MLHYESDMDGELRAFAQTLKGRGHSRRKKTPNESFNPAKNRQKICRERNPSQRSNNTKHVVRAALHRRKRERIAKTSRRVNRK